MMRQSTAQARVARLGEVNSVALLLHFCYPRIRRYSNQSEASNSSFEGPGILVALPARRFAESEKFSQGWDWRNNEHLFTLSEWDHGKYELKHYNAGIITLRQLRDSIDKWAKALDEP